MSQITIKFEVPDKRLADLLSFALEGGSNYWYWIDSYQAPPANPDLPFQYMRGHIFRSIDYPMNDGGSITISAPDDPDRKPVTINKARLLEGLVIMAEKYPGHFSNFLTENEDAETGDVLLQCACFGEIVFG